MFLVDAMIHKEKNIRNYTYGKDSEIWTVLKYFTYDCRVAFVSSFE